MLTLAIVTLLSEHEGPAHAGGPFAHQRLRVKADELLGKPNLIVKSPAIAGVADIGGPLADKCLGQINAALAVGGRHIEATVAAQRIDQPTTQVERRIIDLARG